MDYGTGVYVGVQISIFIALALVSKSTENPLADLRCVVTRTVQLRLSNPLDSLFKK